MVKLKALRAYPYATRKLSAGDVFEASEKDATLLKKIGFAEDETPARTKRTYHRRDLQAER